MKVLVLHGPNLNLFGRREPHIYGTTTLAEIDGLLSRLATELEVDLDIVQSNHEGELIDFLHRNIDVAKGAVVNPAGLTSTACPCTTRSRPCPSPSWKSICPTSRRARRGAAIRSFRRP